MALYFTYAIECYRREDALRICDHLLSVPVALAQYEVRVIGASFWLREPFWLLTAHPEGMGHGCYTFTHPELNRPEMVSAVIEGAYELIARQKGIRRAVCGYEAQDSFEDGYGVPTPNDFSIPGLLFDLAALPQPQLPPGVHRFHGDYYRNPMPQNA